MNSGPSIQAHDVAALSYPFSALQGQARLQLALLLVAVDPRIGGVLIEGARGTAKTTSARALAEILPEGAFVNLPLGASEEHLAGSLDLEIVLQQGKPSFRPGLLARAHKGVLYVDEINLLADTLVDLLLDVCGSGMNRIERDGVSHQHAAEIILVGTMNPEEGELRPQLLDRFGLFVNADELIAMEMRQRIVRSRMAFDDDPVAFTKGYADQQQQRISQLASARQNLKQIIFTDRDYERVARKCHEANVDGVRADLVMLRAGRAMAALEGRLHMTDEDIDAVADMVLAHRRKGSAQASRPEPTRLKGDGDSRQEISETESQSEPAPAEAGQSGGASALNDNGQNSGQPTHGDAPLEDLPDSSASQQGSEPGPVASSESDTAPGTGEDFQWGAMASQTVPIRQVDWPVAQNGVPDGKKG